jgi:predicted pyridoxine 5'-phosphate oxidase superfamily flavin-nucleotide-binding protein
MSVEYHPGEIEVQERAGVRPMAERVGNSIHPYIPPATRGFLDEPLIVVVGFADPDGRVWASLLTGERGFVRALDERTVRIDATPLPDDPLAEVLPEANTEVGMIAIDLATRRRLRLNGEAARRTDGIYVRVRQVYANCHKYIQIREPQTGVSEPGLQDGHTVRSHELTGEQRRLISEADTFFIASAHPEGETDASHRGGNPGFVRFLNENTLEFPDYSGNTMFNTLGNIAVNPNAGLLFLDFERGGTLQLTGEARIVWDVKRAASFARAERVVEFRVEEAIETRGIVPLRWRFEGYSPFNPA